MSQRKRIEEVFGSIKTVALQRKTRFRGLERVGWMFTLAVSAYNLSMPHETTIWMRVP